MVEKVDSPKSKNCFIDKGDGENLEKWSMCLGTLASAAVFIRDCTNFSLLVILKRPVKSNSTQEQEKSGGKKQLAGDLITTVRSRKADGARRTRLLNRRSQPMGERDGRSLRILFLESHLRVQWRIVNKERPVCVLCNVSSIWKTGVEQTPATSVSVLYSLLYINTKIDLQLYHSKVSVK